MTEIFEKIILTFYNNSEFYPQFSTNKLIAKNLAGLCCDHFPDYFNIEKKQGQLIREYFHEKSENKYLEELNLFLEII